jgi:preprotein translocase subunit SecD
MVEQSRQRRVVMAAVIGFALIFVAGGSRYWPRVAVDVVAAVRFEVRLAEENPAPGLREAVVSGSARKIYLHQETIVANTDIAQARVIQSDASTLGVTVTFTADGAAKMLRASRDHIGRPVAILVDGEVVLAPVVRGPISTSAVISGSYTRTEAERIAAGIVGR